MCKGACLAVCIVQPAPPEFIYYIWNQTQTPKLYPLHVGGICIQIRDFMFWPHPCTRALSPVQHYNVQQCSDLNPNFTTWDNPNLKIKLMTENWHKPRKWAAEIFPNIANRGPEPTHLQTMKFIRSTSKVSVYNLITLNNNEINRSPVYFQPPEKDTEARIVNDLAGIFQ